MLEWVILLRNGQMKHVVTNDDQPAQLDASRLILTGSDGAVNGFNWAEVICYEVRAFPVPPT
jgi:hypothetical protein